MSHRRKQEDKRRLKKLYEKTKTYYGAGAYYDSKKNRYIRYSMDHNLTTYFKKVGNHRVRRAEECKNGKFYRRIFDYWWTIL